MNKFLIFALLGIVVAIVLGCSGGESAAPDDKELRKKFAKEKFDMKDVPDNQKAMVQGFIDRAKNKGAQSKPPTAGQ